MIKLLLIIFAGGASVLASRAQVPPRIEPPIITNYVSAFTVGPAGGWSDFANEDQTTNREYTVSFDPSPTAREFPVIYGVVTGRCSRHYSRTNFVGTNCVIRFPIPVTNIITAFCGGAEFFSATNPSGNLFLRSREVNATWTSIESSTNLVDWTLFRFAAGPRTDLSIVTRRTSL